MAWVTMPQLGETVAEGTIGRWLKQVGDRVERGEPIVEVVTDKVNVEVPSDVAGELREILVPEGASAAPGARLALVADAGEAAALTGPVVPTAAVLEVPSTLDGEEGSVPDAPPAPPAVPPVSIPPAVPGARGGQAGHAGRVTPAVQRLARENEVDLGDVPGTGVGGRVTVEDVLAHLVRRRLAEGSPATGSAVPGRAIAGQAVPRPAVAGPGAPAAGSAPASVTVLSQTAPRAPTALSVEVDMSGVVALVDRSGSAYATRAGIELAPISFIVKEAADSRDSLPGALQGAAVGVAIVDLTGMRRGVVAGADRLSVHGVNRALHDLAQGDAPGTAPGDAPGTPPSGDSQDFVGASFVVEDAGAGGALSSIPQVPAGVAVALSAGAILARAVAVESGGGTALAVRRMVVLTAAYDSSLVQAGAVASFLAGIRARLEAVDEETPIY